MKYRPNTITLVTPTIPPRAQMLSELIRSVSWQERLPDRHIIEWDLGREGPGPTRNRALTQVDTEWVGFVDDDDELFPNHVRRCLEYADEADADFVYPTWTVGGRTDDPLEMAKHPDFDPVQLQAGNFIPIAVVIRTEIVHEVGGFPVGADCPVAEGSGTPLEDWGLWLRCWHAGAKFAHLPDKTWRYNFWSGQLHGRPWAPV